MEVSPSGISLAMPLLGQANTGLHYTLAILLSCPAYTTFVLGVVGKGSPPSPGHLFTLIPFSQFQLSASVQDNLKSPLTIGIQKEDSKD